MLRAARTIISTSKNTISALTRLRELSDGFQYQYEDSENLIQCERCNGSGVAIEYSVETGQPYDTQCARCEGVGSVPDQERKVLSVETPKDAILVDLLEENVDIGRLVVYAGFNASIDRIVRTAEKANWFVIRADGESKRLGGKDGMWTSSPIHEPLKAFQDKDRKIPRILFVAHPATAKTSLTLTEACMLVYYSNTFVGDDRIQSEDRIHRIGMDVNRGATIVDILNLPTDAYVLHNIKRKRRLQGITLGQFQAELEADPNWRV
jgi:SNF2 family DNA or RNA helicase